MPDDTIDGQVAEQSSDKSFGDGFADKPESGDKAATEIKADVKSDVKADDAAAPKAEEVKSDAAEKVEPVAKEVPKTAQERMEALAAVVPDTHTESVAATSVETKPAQTPVATVSAPAVQVNWIADLIKLPDVGDIKVGKTSDGKDMTVAEFAAEYPEAVGAPTVLAKIMIEKALGDAETKHGVEMQALRDQVEGMQFWDGVHQAHSDGRKVAASPEFKEWANKQSPLVKALLTSKNIADAVAVLDAYKESLAKATKEGKDKTAREHKDARDALHGESLRGAGAAPAAAKDTEDFDAGFNGKK
ncbi:MAG: hypothetical protein WC497_05575 [Patescibacteria group bacterium]